jgi:hypothetical protein
MRVKTMLSVDFFNLTENARLYEVGNMTDEEDLFTVATRDSEWKVRHAAICRLTNQEKLFVVATTTDHSDRYTAAGCLTDQDKLFYVATRDSYYLVRCVATGRLTDEDKLFTVAMGDSDMDVRSAARNRLKKLGYPVPNLFFRVLAFLGFKKVPYPALPLLEKAKLALEKREVPAGLLVQLKEAVGEESEAEREYAEALRKKEECEKEKAVLEKRIADMEKSTPLISDDYLREREENILANLKTLHESVALLLPVLETGFASATERRSRIIAVFQNAVKTSEDFRNAKKTEHEVLEDTRRIQAKLEHLR